MENKDNIEIKENKETKNEEEYYKKLKEEMDLYLSTHEEPSIFTTKNIHKPLIKIFIVAIIALLIIKWLEPKSYIQDIQGLWLDENNNYYEIYDKTFEMNKGQSEAPFFVGNITNIIKTDLGYIILIDGIHYTNTNTEPYKQMELILKITNYTSQLETTMTANMGTDDYEIVRILDSPKTKR